MQNSLVLSIYRALLRSSKSLDEIVRQAGASAVHLRLPVDLSAWQSGAHKYHPPGTDYYRQALEELFPDLPNRPEKVAFGPGELQACVRENFKRSANMDPKKSDELIDQALRGMRVLTEQTLLAECSSSAVTNGILVEATSSYIGRMQEMNAGQGPGKHLWTYRCRIQNTGEQTVQLWGRHWLVLDESSRLHAEVPYGSQGVIGYKPVLEPGASFEYCSGTELPTPSGTMQGSFQLSGLDQARNPVSSFDARIRPFRLKS